MLKEDTCSVCEGTIGKTSVVEVSGEIDIATVSMLAKALGNAVQSGKGHLILDAQDLAYIDSAGLQTLLSIQLKLATQKRRIAIVGCHGILHKLLKISRFDTQFPMYPTIEEALDGLGDIS